ncbi:hypothetical protein QCN27_03940 [Cereibacter sp. SYSU M97828]|nr:hypothetical protein [Cereibacter flavus]
MPTIITGPVQLPDGTIPSHGRLIFRRKTPRIASPLVVPGPVEARIGANGSFSVTLDGEAEGTAYAVLVEYWDDSDQAPKSVHLPDAVAGRNVAGPVPLADVSAVQMSTAREYVLHKGDSALLPVTLLDVLDRPADISDSSVSSWLERGAERIPIAAAKSNAAAGLIEVTISAAVSAALQPGSYTAVIRLAVGGRVNTLRGIIKVI